MRSSSWLLAIEVTALIAWMALAVGLFVGQDSGAQLLPIDPQALTVTAGSETWMGIYFQGQKVGYAVSGEGGTADGGRVFRNRSAFKLAAFGEIKEVITIGNAVVDSSGALSRFDFFMDSSPVQISARGGVRGKQIVMELTQAGEVQQLVLDIDQPPQISASLSSYISAQQPLHVGQSFDVPYFDPVSMSQEPLQVRVVDVEVLANGEEAWWLERRFGDMVTRTLMTTGGDVIREEGGLGMSLVRETAEVAQTMPEGVEPVDIIGLSAVKLEGSLPDARRLRVLSMLIEGVPPERVRNEPPYQTVSGDQVTVSMPIRAELPGDLPRVEADPALADFLSATPFLPVEHPEIRGQADKLVGDVSARVEAAQKLLDWVFRTLEKRPTIGVPNALEVLRVGQGDCNEHTALYVALARASGIPARIAAGVVYSDRIGSKGAFYYHAWPEVYFGPSAGWVAVDPTFGQFPADATHVKLVEGDLDKQVEIMGVMGRLGFKLVDAR